MIAYLWFMVVLQTVGVIGNLAVIAGGVIRAERKSAAGRMVLTLPMWIWTISLLVRHA